MNRIFTFLDSLPNYVLSILYYIGAVMFAYSIYDRYQNVYFALGLFFTTIVFRVGFYFMSNNKDELYEHLKSSRESSVLKMIIIIFLLIVVVDVVIGGFTTSPLPLISYLIMTLAHHSYNERTQDA